MATARKPLAFDIDRGPPVIVPVVKLVPAQARQQVGARVEAGTYRQLKARAALQGVSVQMLVEQAITEFLANHQE
jgi:predicted secreted protein